MKDELKKEVEGIIFIARHSTSEDEEVADQILSLLAPIIEKWDKVKECAHSRLPCKCPLWKEDACTLEYGGCIFRDVVDALEGGQDDKP